MRRALVILVVAALALSACGRSDDDSAPTASNGSFAAFATKNTTRISAGDSVNDAAAVTQVVFPGGGGDRPAAIALVDSGDWRTAIAAASLSAPPIGAPIVYSDGKDLPDASARAIESADPRGSRTVGGAQLIRVGDAPAVGGRKSITIAGADAAARARSIDALLQSTDARRSDTVIVTGSSDPRFAAPAAALAAKTGAPVLFVDTGAVPAATREAIASHGKPKIVVIGPRSTVGPKALATLKQLGGVVVASDSDDPVKASIAVARFSAGGFGWGIVDPGHGLVFARADDALTVAAAAPLSASGTYGPLIALDDDRLPASAKTYLRQIQPGYDGDPTRGVYNHGWIVGSQKSIPASVQSEIDALLEIQRAG